MVSLPALRSTPLIARFSLTSGPNPLQAFQLVRLADTAAIGAAAYAMKEVGAPMDLAREAYVEALFAYQQDS